MRLRVKCRSETSRETGWVTGPVRVTGATLVFLSSTHQVARRWRASLPAVARHAEGTYRSGSNVAVKCRSTFGADTMR